MPEASGPGYASEALDAELSFLNGMYGISDFFYMADVRNMASMKLLGEYSFEKGEFEAFETESGKYLELQGYTIHF